MHTLKPQSHALIFLLKSIDFSSAIQSSCNSPGFDSHTTKPIEECSAETIVFSTASNIYA